MGTTLSKLFRILTTSSSNQEESRGSMDDERELHNLLPVMSFNENDLLLLKGGRHLYHQTTESICASLDGSDDEEDAGLDEEDWNERLLILEDAANLSRLADFYLNPHKALVPSDPYAYGRNYFSRPSAYNVKTMEGDDEDDEDQMKCLSGSTQADRIWIADMPLTTVSHGDVIPHQELLKGNTIGSDPSCVVRFGLQYDNH